MINIERINKNKAEIKNQISPKKVLLNLIARSRLKMKKAEKRKEKHLKVKVIYYFLNLLYKYTLKSDIRKRICLYT